ncbi:MAG: hypothetical protein ACTH1W_05085 [Advenella sp.]
MKERLDCALIRISGCEMLAETLLKQDRLHSCRLHLTPIEPACAVQNDPFPPVTLLQDMTYSLRHFDAICLPVSAASLVWTRLLLQQTRIEQHRPIFVLGLSLRPIGLIDLLELGVVDFALWPCEPEEIRVRLLRALQQLRSQHARLPSLLGDTVSTQQYAVQDPATLYHGDHGSLACMRLTADKSGSSMHLLRKLSNQGPTTGEIPGAGTIPHHASSPASPVSLLHGVRSAVLPAATPANAYLALPTIPKVCCQEIAQFPEGFQQLKSVVVAQFERTYLTHALARSKGNIALAARNSHKHRRAFWALMRKHQISADPFRDHDF